VTSRRYADLALWLFLLTLPGICSAIAQGAAWLPSVSAAWVLLALGTAMLVSGAVGILPAAIALVLLPLHPILYTLGSRVTPWLPAAVFTWISFSFLQAIALQTVYRGAAKRKRAFSVRFLAMLGCGTSLGVAASAEARIAWVMLIHGSLLLLAFLFTALTLLRVRKRMPLDWFLAHPWSPILRVVPWALNWFTVLSLLVGLHALLGESRVPIEQFFGVGETTLAERIFAYASLPGILLLAIDEGRHLWLRSRITGRSVLFLCLAVLWLAGPAAREEPTAFLRLLAAPVFAASLAALFRSRR